MKTTSSMRYLIAGLAIFSMLFMQLAVAAYNCPMTTMLSQKISAQPLAPVVMSNCTGMDNEMPVLCHVHADDEVAGQSLDKPALPTIAPFFPAQLSQLLSAVNPDQAIGHSQDMPLDLTRRIFPPAAIRHCCFRI